jgi:hypothetical protein
MLVLVLCLVLSKSLTVAVVHYEFNMFAPPHVTHILKLDNNGIHRPKAVGPSSITPLRPLLEIHECLSILKA